MYILDELPRVAIQMEYTAIWFALTFLYIHCKFRAESPVCVSLAEQNPQLSGQTDC